MNKRFTRAANAASNSKKKTPPKPKRLDFSTPSSANKNSTPKSKKKGKKESSPKGNSAATASTTNTTTVVNSASTIVATTSTASAITTVNLPSSSTNGSSQRNPSPHSPSSVHTPPPDTGNSTMASARVPFPPFKTDDIEAWFRRVEHWFTFGKVATETEKFALIASQIDNSTVANLDEMLTPNADTPYTNLKKKIISIFEATTTAKINNLLSGCKLGDLKPSQLLAEMKRMGGNVGDEILRNLWAKRLPLHVQTVVASATKSSLDEVSLIADAVIDVVGRPSSFVNQVTDGNNQQSSYQENSSTKSTEIEDLRAAVNQLTKSFRDMQSDRSRSKSKDNQYNRDRSSSSKPSENRVCRYHRKFGAKAWLCTKPCSFVAETDSKN